MNKSLKYILCPMLVLSSSAFAVTTTTTTFAVNASVIDSCSVSATPLAFGLYSTTSGTANDAAGTVTPTCTLLTAYTVALNAGTGTGATFASRIMTGIPSGLMTYSIYTSALRTTVWGDGTASSQIVAGIGTGLPQILPTSGRIPAGQLVGVGTYADTITVTLTY